MKTEEAAAKETKSAPAPVIRTPDFRILSFPRSGRTWLASMATWYIAKALGIPAPSEQTPIRGVTPLPERHPEYLAALLAERKRGRFAPLLRFQHPGGARPDPYYVPSPIKYDPRHSILVLRDPRDVLVSYFHYVMFHKRKGGFRIDAEWHSLAPDTSPTEFVYLEGFGIRKIAGFMDTSALWAEEHDVHVVFYDDMARAPADALQRFLLAVGFEEVDHDLLCRAVEEHSFARMKARAKEREKAPDRARVRAGQSGTYRGLLDDPEIAFCDSVVDSTRSALLGRYRTG